MEHWKDIDGYNGKYSVSTLGRVRNNYKGFIRNAQIHKSGYYYICFKVNKKKVHYQLHRLVLMTFKPIINPSAYQVHHINWDPSDNRLENLAWTTVTENQQLKMHHSKSFAVYKELLRIYTDDELSVLLRKIKGPKT